MTTFDSHVTSIARAATLDGFVRHVAESEGVNVRALDPLTTLSVQTCNSTYRLVVSDGDRVLVQGGRFFPEPTRARLAGSGFGGSLLKLDWIGVGLRVELNVGDQRIVTSPVRRILREPPPTRPH